MDPAVVAEIKARLSDIESFVRLIRDFGPAARA